MIISAEYRVNSQQGTNFRRWSNHVLKENLLKGYIINENRVIDIDNRLLKAEDQVFNNYDK